MLSSGEIYRKYNFSTKKSLGQNFLLDPHITDRIADEAAPLEGKNVLEIGPGLGSLSRAILNKNPKKLVTLDQDQRCIDILNTEIAPFYKNLETIQGDAVRVEEKNLFGEKFKIVANLPYNVGTTLLLKWLKNSLSSVESITILLQKEVAERILAKPGNGNFCRLAAICGYLCIGRKCFDLPPGVFCPPPKVHSSLIQLTPKDNVNATLIPKLFTLTSAIFAKRRKTLRNNLLASRNYDNFGTCGVNLDLRADQLNRDDLDRLLDCL